MEEGWGQEGEGKYLFVSLLLPRWNVNQCKEVSPFGVCVCVSLCVFVCVCVCMCVCVGVKRSDMVFWPFGALSEVLQVNNCAQGSITMPFTTFFTSHSPNHRIQINTSLIHQFWQHYHDNEKAEWRGLHSETLNIRRDALIVLFSSFVELFVLQVIFPFPSVIKLWEQLSAVSSADLLYFQIQTSFLGFFFPLKEGILFFFCQWVNFGRQTQNAVQHKTAVSCMAMVWNILCTFFFIKKVCWNHTYKGSSSPRVRQKACAVLTKPS